jgi:hypothetical protein
MGSFVKPDGNAMVQLWEHSRAALGMLAELWEPSGTVGSLGTQWKLCQMMKSEGKPDDEIRWGTVHMER